MDMKGGQRIPACRSVVWQALNDPVILKNCIPGCESLEQTDSDQMKATAAIKIGPVSARFSGNIKFSDVDPPNGYRISGEGKGGIAGFAKGSATVSLQDDGPDTVLRYEVQAQVGGKLAQLGARMIDATAKQMADSFFASFSTQVAAMAQVRAEEAAAAATDNTALRVQSNRLSGTSFSIVPQKSLSVPAVAGIIVGVGALLVIWLVFGNRPQ